MATAYDPNVLASFADRLYARARTIALLWGLLGAISGLVAFGILAATNNLGGSMIGGWILVAIATLIGVAVGTQKALMLRVQAQTMLCQVAVETGIRELVAAVRQPYRTA